MGSRTFSLTQHQTYKSINKFKTVELPFLTILTGVNGSGKSHLLEAIRDRHIHTDIAPNKSDIRLFNWNDLVPTEVGITNLSNVYVQRDWFISLVRNHRTNMQQYTLDLLRRYSLDQHFLDDPWGSLSKSVKEFVDLGISDESAQAIKLELNGIEDGFLSQIRSQMGNDEIKNEILQELISDKVLLHTISASTFEQRAFSFYGSNMFQHSFGELFFSYFDKLKANRLRQMDVAEGRIPSVPVLSEPEFKAIHGSPPWDFVNDTLKEARLDFQIDYPKSYEATEFWPRLTKISTNTKVEFSSLSSGEKILMSFAFCLYNSTDKRQKVKRPKLLLFDEIDAPLHPSMSRVLLNIIDKIIVKQEGIAVILVTHSPSTVAVAPDESIHLLEPSTNIISPESKRRAVSTLTADIPTMSIDFSGRRQVFVESDFDADRYQLLYQLLAPIIESERSLSFIGVGHANMGTGCAQVVSTVTALTKAGNTSVLGLIDWDAKNEPTDRVFVLGHKYRYAIENYLLDPLLLAAAILNEDPSGAVGIGLDASATFTTFSKLAPESLQAAINSIQGKIVARMNIAVSEDYREVRYGANQVFMVDDRYMNANGHDLERAIIEEFPKLRRFNGTGRLLHHMIDVVIRNHLDLVPEQLVEAIRWLCNTRLE